MGQIFNVSVKTVSEHLQNIFSTGELDEDSVVRKFRITAKDGKSYNTLHYNLDAVLSVGYRVNSAEATRFRQWTTKTLRAYLEQGYLLNETLLRQRPDKLNELARQVRALRSEERSVYEKVRECFKISASDYSPTSKEVRRFYALLQDKFHHAVTQMTGSKLILDRADHTAEAMGLKSFKGDHPAIAEAKVGKNYLTENELYRLHLLSEQFLLYAESTAMAGRKMTMHSLHEQLDRLLVLNNYPVFDGWRDYLKDEAISHAEREYEMYAIRRRVEAAGLTYDIESYVEGEYDDILAAD